MTSEEVSADKERAWASLRAIERRLGALEARFTSMEQLIIQFRGIESKTLAHLSRFNETSHVAHDALAELRAVVKLQDDRRKYIDRYVDKHAKKAV